MSRARATLLDTNIGLPILLTILTFGQACWPDSRPSQADRRSNTLCIYRPEQSGIVNIVPVTFIIMDVADVKLFGGDEKCLATPPNNVHIRLLFQNPYGPPENPQYWKTKAEEFQFANDKKINITLCEAVPPGRNGNWIAAHWHDMWKIKRTLEADVGKCAVS
jgi:hypothetical protein